MPPLFKRFNDKCWWPGVFVPSLKPCLSSPNPSHQTSVHVAPLPVPLPSYATTTQPLADLCANVSLREVRLRGCGLNNACAEALAAVLPEAKALQLLDLSDNCFTAKGGAALAEGIRKLKGPSMDAPSPSRMATMAQRSAVSDEGGEGSGDMTPSQAPSTPQRKSRMGLESAQSVVSSLSVPTAVTSANNLSRSGTQMTRQSSWRSAAYNPGSQLHTLLLCNNPLGRNGVVHLLHVSRCKAPWAAGRGWGLGSAAGVGMVAPSCFCRFFPLATIYATMLLAGAQLPGP